MVTYIVFMIYLILDNYIDGEEFISLSETEIKSMVPPIGLARKILRLIPVPSPQTHKVHTVY